MSGNEQLTKQREEQELQRSTAMQLLDQYATQGVETLLPEQLAGMHNHLMYNKNAATAESVRLGLTQLREPRAEVLRPASPPPMPTVPDLSSLSSRQRRKLKSRQKDYVKRARRLGYVQVTDETLPLSRELKKIREANPDGTPPNIENWKAEGLAFRFNLDLFAPSFNPETDLSFNVSAIHEQISRAEAITARANLEPDSLNIEEKARFELLEETTLSAKEALRTLITANGVNSETGAPADEAQALSCLAEKDAAMLRFRELVWNRERLFTDKVEAKLLEPLAREEDFIKAEDREMIESRLNYEEADKPYYAKMISLDFEFSNYISAEDYMANLKMLDNNPERYAEHKDLIDRMFKEYTACEKKSAEYARKVKQLSRFGTGSDGDPEISMDTEVLLQERLISSEDYKGATQRITFLNAALKHLLTGKRTEDWVHFGLEKDFGLVTKERAETNAALETLKKAEEQNALFEREQREFAARKEDEAYLPKTPEEIPAFLSERLIRHYRGTSNGERNNRDILAETRLDRRSLRVYGTGYQVDEQGEPVTLLDAHLKAECRKYYSDMLSGDRNLITPQLDRIMERILSFRPDVNMLKSDYILKNVAELSSMCDQMTYIENLMKDYSWYFEALSKPKQHQIAESTMAFATFCAAFNTRLKQDAVESNGGKLFTGFEKELLSTMARNEYPNLELSLSRHGESYKEFCEGINRYSSDQAQNRVRTPEELQPLSTVYTKLYKEKHEEREACKELLKDELTHEELASFMSSQAYSRSALRMVPSLGREENLARLRNEYHFQICLKKQATVSVANPEELAEHHSVYQQVKAGCQTELLNLLHYIDELDLTEDQVLDRAEELCHTEMSWMHLSDIANLKNPLTNKSMKEELFGKEFMEVYALINLTLSDYKCLIRGCGLGLDGKTLEGNRKGYSITSANDPFSIRQVLVRERKKGIDGMARRKEQIKALVQRRKDGWNPPLPPGTPPQPLHRQ